MLGKATHRVSHMLFQPFHPKFAQKISKKHKTQTALSPCVPPGEWGCHLDRTQHVLRPRQCRAPEAVPILRWLLCRPLPHRHEWPGSPWWSLVDGGSRFFGNQIVRLVFLGEIRCYVIFHQVDVTSREIVSGPSNRWNLRLTMAGKVPVLVGIPLSGLQTWESDPTCWDYPSF